MFKFLYKSSFHKNKQKDKLKKKKKKVIFKF